jgi:pyruvate dehydrogenase E2 component (dihydrolipoamide acetyltransferase)
MAKEITMPKLGQTMEEGTIVNTLVKVGDKVAKGDVLFEVETDKATLEADSPAEGFVKAILVKNGETVPVNAPILILGAEHETVDVAPATISAPSAPPAAPAPVSAASAAPAAARGPAPEASAATKVIRLPKLGQTMEEGTIVTTLVKVGDKVNKGDVLFEVETDKATLEADSPAEGFVKAILVKVGETIPVNDPILVLAGEHEELPQGFVDALVHEGSAPAETVPDHVTAAQHEAASPETMMAPAPAPTAAMTAPAEKLFATPRAKMIAQELGIDLSGVTPANALRIVEADVRRMASSGAGKTAKAPAAAATTTAIPEVTPKYSFGQKIKVNRLQKIVAEKMLWSKQNIPCFYLNIRADVTALVALRTKLNKTAPVKLSFNDFILRALAVGMQHYPIMTGQLAGDHIQLANRLDFGLAISTDDGLVAPIIPDCGPKSVHAIAAYCKGLIDRTRANKLSLDDLQGGCITVSNLGGFGIDSFIPIVVPGQTSILGVGAIADTVIPSDGNLLVRKLMNMTLSVDHKVVNGAEAAQFLDFVKKLLEHPEGLVD